MSDKPETHYKNVIAMDTSMDTSDTSMDTSNDDAIASFIAFTGADNVMMAQQFLKMANNDVEKAANLFLFEVEGGPEPDEDDHDDVSVPTAPAPAPAKDESDADKTNVSVLPSGLVTFDLGKDPKMQEQLPPKKRKPHNLASAPFPKPAGGAVAGDAATEAAKEVKRAAELAQAEEGKTTNGVDGVHRNNPKPFTLASALLPGVIDKINELKILDSWKSLDQKDNGSPYMNFKCEYTDSDGKKCVIILNEDQLFSLGVGIDAFEAHRGTDTNGGDDLVTDPNYEDSAAPDTTADRRTTRSSAVSTPVAGLPAKKRRLTVKSMATTPSVGESSSQETVSTVSPASNAAPSAAEGTSDNPIVLGDSDDEDYHLGGVRKTPRSGKERKRK